MNTLVSPRVNLGRITLWFVNGTLWRRDRFCLYLPREGIFTHQPSTTWAFKGHVFIAFKWHRSSLEIKRYILHLVLLAENRIIDQERLVEYKIVESGYQAFWGLSEVHHVHLERQQQLLWAKVYDLPSHSLFTECRVLSINSLIWIGIGIDSKQKTVGCFHIRHALIALLDSLCWPVSISTHRVHSLGRLQTKFTHILYSTSWHYKGYPAGRNVLEHFEFNFRFYSISKATN